MINLLDKSNNNNDNNRNNNPNNQNDNQTILLDNVMNSLIMDIENLEKEISLIKVKQVEQEVQDLQQKPYKKDLKNLSLSILKEFESSKVLTPRDDNYDNSHNNNSNSNNNEYNNHQQQNIDTITNNSDDDKQQPQITQQTQQPLQQHIDNNDIKSNQSQQQAQQEETVESSENNVDKLIEIKLIDKIFDINKAFDGKSNNLFSSFQNETDNCTTSQQTTTTTTTTKTQQQSTQQSTQQQNNVTIGSIRDLNKLHPQNLNDFGDWKSLIDEELSDLYSLVKELKQKVQTHPKSNISTNSKSTKGGGSASNSIHNSPTSSISSGRNKHKALYLYNNTFTNILQLKHDLITITQSPLFNQPNTNNSNKFLPPHTSQQTITSVKITDVDKDSNHHNSNTSANIVNSNSKDNNNNSPPNNKKSVKQLVLLFSP